MRHKAGLWFVFGVCVKGHQELNLALLSEDRSTNNIP
jgi:hypothetical protein